MPRFTLSAQEQSFVGQALAQASQEAGLDQIVALYRAAATTPAELRALVQTYLTQSRAARAARLAAIDGEAAATKAQLNSEITVIDAALAKLV